MNSDIMPYILDPDGSTFFQVEIFESLRLENIRKENEENEKSKIIPKSTIPNVRVNQEEVVIDNVLQQRIFEDINKRQNVIKNPGNGDCLFWTLIQATHYSGLKMDSYLDSPGRVRNEIALWFLQTYHSDKSLKSRFPNIKDLENFNKLLVQNGVWTKLDKNKSGFDLIFYVVSKSLNTNIVLCNYSNKNKKWNGIVFRGSTNKHRFFVQLKNEHFQLIEGNDFINSIDLCNFEKLD